MKKKYETAIGGEIIPKRKNKTKSYPVTVSDWIQFLSDVINYYETLFGRTMTSVFTIAAVTIALFSLFISATFLAVSFAIYGFSIDIGTFNATIIILTVILGGTSLFLVFYSIYQKYSKKSKYKKAGSLLKDVLKGNITDPKDIRDEWFEDENN